MLSALSHKAFVQILALSLPSTGEQSTLPMVLGFLGLAAVLFIIMLILRRKQK